MLRYPIPYISTINHLATHRQPSIASGTFIFCPTWFLVNADREFFA